jgi:hypothetical protein
MALVIPTNSISTAASNIYLPPTTSVDSEVDISPWLAGRIEQGATAATLHLRGFPLARETNLVLISRIGAQPIDWDRDTTSEQAAEDVNAASAIHGIVALAQGRQLELRSQESGANSVVEIDLLEGDLDIGLGSASGADAVVQHDWDVAVGT